MFVNVLRSMGIQNYDPLVTTALNEYARSYTASLLIDAKDYAAHANRSVGISLFHSNSFNNLCLGLIQYMLPSFPFWFLTGNFR